MSSPNPAQLQVLDAGLLWSGFPAVVQMPTGAGKTWLAGLAVRETLARGQVAVVLVPLRATAAEIAASWGREIEGVGAFWGGRTSRPMASSRVLVMTPERLDLVTRRWRRHQGWLPRVGLVVVDELHMLGEPVRGPRLEGALCRLRRLNPLARVLGLSATLGNRHELAAWLGGVAHHSQWRPVPLRWRVERWRRPEDKPALLARVVRPATESGRSLVFVQSRRRAEDLAASLRGQGIAAVHHHAGLGAPERAAVEDDLRARRVAVVVSTGTLEMGLNLPVRQVVLYDLQRFDGSRHRPLEVWRVWQRAGRAGRPGLDDEGEAVLLAPAWDRAAARYPRGAFEPVRSGLADEAALAEAVLVEVVAGLARSDAQLTRALGHSLAAHQGRLPDSRALTADMVEAGLLEVEEGRYRATRAGRVAARHLLAPAAVLHLQRLLADLEGPSVLDLLLAALTSGECALVPVDFEALDALAADLSGERSQLLAGHLAPLGSGRRLLAALGSAMALRAWTRTGDAEAVATRTGCYPAEVRRLSEDVARVLGAAGALDLHPERSRAVAAMVRLGLDEEAVSLTQLAGVGGVLARRLVDAGWPHVEALVEAQAEDIARVRGVSLSSARRWIHQAEGLSSWRFADSGPRVGPAASTWPEGVDPYRLRRALDLVVVAGDGVLVVRGGSEPHRVVGDRCDCADAAAGHTCKHTLAARLHRAEPDTAALAARLEREEPGGLDLQALWMDR